METTKLPISGMFFNTRFNKRGNTPLKVFVNSVHQGAIVSRCHMIQGNPMSMDFMKSFLFVCFIVVCSHIKWYSILHMTSEKPSLSISNLRTLLSTCKPINEMCGPLSSINPEVSVSIICAGKKMHSYLNQLTDYKLAYL